MDGLDPLQIGCMKGAFHPSKEGDGMYEKAEKSRYNNPRFRAYGRARLDIAQRARTREQWDQYWKGPIHPYLLALSGPWKQCVEYRVDDFATEVGFFIDGLGLPVIAFDLAYAMFTSPDQEFTFSVVPAGDGLKSTPPDAIRIQFMVADIFATVTELERRRIFCEEGPRPCTADSSLYIACFRTPHGIPIELWGRVELGEEVKEGYHAGERKTEEGGLVKDPAFPAKDPKKLDVADLHDQTSQAGYGYT
jgi:catechol 2,3-dioxygenase-like lactoylglutathione lyase family enzyme